MGIMKKKKEDEGCGGCTYCCNLLTFTMPSELVDFAFREFYKTRNCQLNDTATVTYITVPFPCPHLVEGEGCAIHEDKPLACQEFDGRDHPVTKEVCEKQRGRRHGKKTFLKGDAIWGHGSSSGHGKKHRGK